MKPLLIAFLAASLFASDQKALTNHDVVVLAKAGFTEDFIIDTIAAQKSAFDTTASSLADLAKEGINEHILRAMAGVKADVLPASPPPSEGSIPGTAKKTHPQSVKPTRAGLAIATQTPYYESTSFLFGLFHKKIGVGVLPHPDQIIAPRFGTNTAPSGSATRYVVIP
jgi:hypothetical protein